MPIRILDAKVIAQIAAGEVIERPFSVVKELLENSLDAGATSVSIEIQEGGIDLIRVTDNGCGMSPSDAKLSFENHATSKIRESSELLDIRTFGFRGEAMASIGAVSKVEMLTRRQGTENGVSIRYEGGRFMDMKEVGCPEGTTIQVRDLFFNLPVRRAFIKRASYEAGRVEDMVGKMILGNPDISIRLISSGKTKLHSYGDGNLIHAALSVFGEKVASQMQTIDAGEGALRIHGLLGLGSCARANSSHQSFYVNGRLVSCPIAAQALEEACKGRVMIGMHPICAISLTMPPQQVDVNVHPNKLEVRFRDEANIRQSLLALFQAALEASDGMLNLGALQMEKKSKEFERAPIQYLEQARVFGEETEVGIKETKVENIQTEVGCKQTEVHINPTEVDKVQPAQAPTPQPRIVQSMPSREPAALQEQLFPPKQAVVPAASAPHTDPEAQQQQVETHERRFRVIGVAFDAYLFVEVGNNVLIIDQHAAHERLLYEKYRFQLENGGNVVQTLLAPMIIHVSRREFGLLVDNQTLLYDLGYEIEPFGETDIQLRSVPFIMGEAQHDALFMSMLEKLDDLHNATLERRRTDLIKYCCRRAVKAGDRLNDTEINALLDDMINSKAPPTCPHGRPVVKTLGKNEIEKYFKR